MELGPFEPSDAQQIEQIFNQHNIPFEVKIDETLKDSQLESFNNRVRNNPIVGMGSLDLRYIYFIISDEDAPKASSDLKPFGIEC